MKFLKTLMILTVLAGAFSMGACQNRGQTTTTTEAPAYHK